MMLAHTSSQSTYKVGTTMLVLSLFVVLVIERIFIRYRYLYTDSHSSNQILQKEQRTNRPHPTHPLYVSLNLTTSRQEDEQPLSRDSDSCEEDEDTGTSTASKPWIVKGISFSTPTNDDTDSCLWSSTSSTSSSSSSLWAIRMVQPPSSSLTATSEEEHHYEYEDENEEDEDEDEDPDDEYYLHVNFEPDYNDIELHHVYDDQDEDYFYTYYIENYHDDDEVEVFQRKIYWYDDRDYEEYRHRFLYGIDDPYFDEKKYSPDESIQDEFGGSSAAADGDDDDDSEESESYCQRNSWKRKLFLTCNTFHEIPLELSSKDDDGSSSGVGDDDDISSSYQTKYLGSGHFRNAFLFELPYSYDGTNDRNEKFVYKVLRYIDEFHVDHADMERVHKEAIIMERLTHSPRTINTYGYCSTSIFTQAMQHSIWQHVVPGQGQMSQVELDTIQEQQTSTESDGAIVSDVHPFNNYTVVEKLHMALRMAEALADMHGYEHGVIVHGDVHPEQWLLDFNNEIILNDFNNAEILDYDPHEQQYCGSYRKQGGGFRAPEEYVGSYIDESVDIFSMGNNIYCLLTGLWPFYEWTSYSDIERKLLNHERAYIDPRYRTRSFIESKLVEIMERTWEFEPEDRVSIFEVVEFLRDVVKENERRMGLGIAEVMRVVRDRVERG